MSDDRTELEWSYEPTDLFERPYRLTLGCVELSVDGGRAVAVLRPPVEEVSPERKCRVTDVLTALLNARSLQGHHAFRLDARPMVTLYRDGKRHIDEVLELGVYDIIVG